jgi:phosphodiesterase/alkaline phosphatase D-like protein
VATPPPFIDGATVTYAASATTFDIQRPTTGGALVVGDLLLAEITWNTADATAPARTLPSGWTTLTGLQLIGSSTTSGYGEAAYHFVTSAEVTTPPASWAITAGTNAGGSVVTARFRGVDQVTPFAVNTPGYAVAVDNTSGLTIAAPTVTTNTADTTAIIGASLRNGSNELSSLTAGWTVAAESFGDGGRAGGIAYQTRPGAAGVTPAATWTMAGNVIGLSWASALKPTSGTAATVTGVTATGTGTALAGVLTAAVLLAGAIGTGSATAPAGTVRVAPIVTGITATGTGLALPGTLTAGATIVGATAGGTGAALPGQVAAGSSIPGTVAGATATGSGTALAGGLTAGAVLPGVIATGTGQATTGLVIVPGTALGATPAAGTGTATAGTLTAAARPVGDTATGTGAANPGSAFTTTGTLIQLWTGIPNGTSIAIRTKTTAASSVRLKIGTNSAVTTGVTFTSAATPDSSGYTAFTATGLSTGTAYWYRAEIDGTLNTAQTGSFGTDTPTVARSYRVAFGACMTSSNSTATAFNNILTNAPELFIHLGDWHYDNDTSTSQSAHQASIESQVNGNTGLASLIRQVPLAYVWSDHDSGNNDWTGGPQAWTPSYNAAYRVILPVAETLPTGGVYRSFGRGRVKFILTDGRSFKSPAANTDNAAKTMFGTVQEAWIASELADPTFPVKVICLDVPWVYAATAGDDKWGGYTAAANRLVAAIASAGANVFLIHGDAHMLCADDGTSANNRGSLPVAGAAPFGNTTSTKGGPYSQGTYLAGAAGTVTQMHGLLDVTDTGSSISIRFSGRDAANAERITLTKAFTITTPATVTGATAGGSAQAVPGVLSVGGRVTGVAATGTGQSPAGTPTAAATVAGATAVGSGQALAGSAVTGATATVVGATATGSGTGRAGSITAGVAVVGATATGTATSPTGTPAVPGTVVGVLATGSGAAPAGTFTAGSSITGATASGTGLALAGSPSAAALRTGATATGTGQTFAGSAVIGVAVPIMAGPGDTLTVPADPRTLKVRPQPRTLTVTADPRTLSVPPTLRR